MTDYTREEILKLIEENGGPEGLDLSGKDLPGIKLSREKIVEEVEKARERAPDETPVWYSELTGGVNLAGVNLQGTNLVDAKLQGANLINAELQGAYLGGVNLQGARLDGARLHGAHLDCADLREANLAGASLRGVVLKYCHLENVDLYGVKSLNGAYFYNVFLDKTRMRRLQIGEQIGEELRGRHYQAKEAYLALKNNFAEIGHYDDAAWAYCKERRMEKLTALQEAKLAWQVRDWKRALCRYAKVARDQLEECACDYGESVPRVLCSLLAVYVLFTLIYGLTWSVIRVHATPTTTIREPTWNLVDLARFSLGAMTTMDLTGLEPRNGLVELLAGLEALLGIALTGLLGFVVGNRIGRR
jgi:uncharacterized protein YjbI with pentapeptide repeats